LIVANAIPNPPTTKTDTYDYNCALTDGNHEDECLVCRDGFELDDYKHCTIRK
jgi:hypothetical protein